MDAHPPPSLPDEKLLDLWRAATRGMGAPRVEKVTGVARSVHQRMLAGETSHPSHPTREKMIHYLLRTGWVSEDGEVRDPWDYEGAAGDALVRSFRMMASSPAVKKVVNGKLTYADFAAMLMALAGEQDLDPVSLAIVHEYVAELFRLHAQGGTSHEERSAEHESRRDRVGAGVV